MGKCNAILACMFGLLIRSNGTINQRIVFCQPGVGHPYGGLIHPSIIYNKMRLKNKNKNMLKSTNY